MTMLPLDSPRWSLLQTHSEDGGWVPRWLRRVLESPDDIVLLNEGACRLWSDENAWSASFAAAPYLVQAATRASPSAQLEYVILLGLIAAYRTMPGTVDAYDARPPDLEEWFRKATDDALSLAVGLLPMTWQERLSSSLIAAVAAFKGLLGLSRAIESGGVICNSCGVVVDLDVPKYPYGDDIAF
jgi:hypothetical protein